MATTSCGTLNHSLDQELNSITIGEFEFDFPKDFKLIPLKGIDSYVGKVEGDSFTFSFDYGAYSNSLAQTPQEYIDQGSWKIFAQVRFMEEGKTYTEEDLPKVDYLYVRPASDSSIYDYIARCKHNDLEFDLPFGIPDEIKNVNFKIDTFDNVYRKIVWSNDPYTGITGIYLCKLPGYGESLSDSYALSMTTSRLTHETQELAIRIFNTNRRIIYSK
jgi:hypothetical protein